MNGFPVKASSAGYLIATVVGLLSVLAVWLYMQSGPSLILNGDDSLTIVQGRTFTDPGASATDEAGQVLEVIVTGEVSTDIIGSYLLTYKAIDVAGNDTSASREVIVREARPFITTWKTDREKWRSGNNEISIKTSTNDQNYTVDWGDGSKDENVKGGTGHTYDSPGIYTVTISGDFKNIWHGLMASDSKKLLSIEQWGDVQWSTMYHAFMNCENLILNAKDTPDLSSVKNMSYMFWEAFNLNADLSQWDVSTVTDMSFMFSSADVFNGDISDWDVSSVTNMEGMFSGAHGFNSDISKWNVSSVTNMGSMFSSTESFDSDLREWNVSSVTNMESLFRNATEFNGDISKWDVSKVTTMKAMFKQASDFNSDISQWDVSAVTDMYSMFKQANNFNGDISKWDVSEVTNMSYMFSSGQYKTKDFVSHSFNGDLSHWDVSSVKDMSFMFSNNQIFNGDISAWNVSSVTKMTSMLSGVDSFDGDVSQWDVSAVNSMYEMFAYSDKFNSDLSQWDVSSVTSMNKMFTYASAFKGDISKWDLSSVNNMDKIFYGITISKKNYDALLLAWGEQTLQRYVKGPDVENL